MNEHVDNKILYQYNLVIIWLPYTYSIFFVYFCFDLKKGPMTDVFTFLLFPHP